jgi:hypothetical protein
MLIWRKMEIHYSKRDSSMMEFAAIDEIGEVACIDGASHHPPVRPDEWKSDRYDWNLLAVTGVAIECIVLGWLLLSEKPSATFFDKKPSHQ